MKNMYLFLFLWLSLLTTSAQKQMTLEDAVLGRYGKLSPKRLRSLQWKDSGSFVYLWNDTLWVRQIRQARPEVWLSTKQLNRAAGDSLPAFHRFPEFRFSRNGCLLIQTRQQLMIYDPENDSLSLRLEIPEQAEATDFCEQNNSLAYVKGRNLYLLSPEGEKQLSFEVQSGIVCGRAVHRREFGISKGTFWSNSGKYLAFYRKDESRVEDYPLVDYTCREAELHPVKYPMAGMTSHRVSVGIYNLGTGKTVYLQTGEPDDHYLTNLSWGPDDRYIYLAELNREQNRMELNQYDAVTGKKSKTLFRESSPSYVEPQHPLFFSKNNPAQFYYWSRKDGWFHLYLYNTEGKLIRQLTRGKWEVTGFYGTDPAEKYLYFQSTQGNPTERQICRLNMKTGKISRLSQESGFHKALFSPGFRHFLDCWEACDVPSCTDLYEYDGKKTGTVHRSKDPLSGYELGENKMFTIKAADGKTDLYCRMILPVEFNPTKKYPVILYVYGGPHVQLVQNSWHHGADWWQYYMAANGYIIFTVDSRGSDNRGKAFEEIIHRQLGITETADQMKGVEYLLGQPWVDRNRIGVHGWSYGGFMSLNLMLRHPEVFRVGIAGGPVVDWEMYEVMYGERYMDLPEENPEGYQKSNMSNLAGRLKGKLMLIHGAQDETVVMQHSMKFLRECIRQNKPVDFFAYPTHPHNVHGKDRLHLMDKISRYFQDYL
ncbi:MAG: DPP IV N-terminal domain-containing protein [Mangrovibacterium sp.]